MEKQILNTDQAPAPIGPYNQAVRYGDLLFISGQICLDPATGQLKNSSLQEETHQVMANLKAILHEAGLGFGKVLKTSIFLTDMNRFSEVNEIYGQYFESAFPARETVQVSA
ncbi:MAG: RidA family protein, partial [Chitinophagaceae bacterium]